MCVDNEYGSIRGRLWLIQLLNESSQIKSIQKILTIHFLYLWLKCPNLLTVKWENHATGKWYRIHCPHF